MNVSPIRDIKDIQSIKRLLSDNKRDLFLFTLGINCGARGGDLVTLRVSDFLDKGIGDTITIKEGKTGKTNHITINKAIHDVWLQYKQVYDCKPNDFVFFSRKQGYHLCVNSVSRLVKDWCHMINLKGNYGSHTLRKTFGYIQRTKYNVSIDLLMTKYNHASTNVTKRYIGVTQDEINNFCLNSI